MVATAEGATTEAENRRQLHRDTAAIPFARHWNKGAK